VGAVASGGARTNYEVGAGNGAGIETPTRRGQWISEMTLTPSAMTVTTVVVAQAAAGHLIL
jgi:hypothetical protein